MKGKPVTPPIVLSATYKFENSDELIDVVQHRSGYIYSRWDNPTVREAEQMLASIEGYSNVVGFGSGMAAITSSILAFVEKGGRVVAIQTYGETFRFIHDYLPRMGVDTIGLNCDDVDRCEAEFKKGATLLFLESPMNPLLRVIDVRPLAQLAHEHGAVVVLDSTFASPVNQRPIELGVDIAIHSATKYLGGHHDITAGFACCNEEHHEAIWKQRRMFGGILDPMTAFLAWRGMQTLEVRVKRQNDTAMTVAQFLSTRKHVDTRPLPRPADPSGSRGGRSPDEGVWGNVELRASRRLRKDQAIHGPPEDHQAGDESWRRDDTGHSARHEHPRFAFATGTGRSRDQRQPGEAVDRTRGPAASD